MAADDLTIAHTVPPPVSDRDGGSWLLRTLKPGERVTMTGGIILELQQHKGRPRIAICAPIEIRAVFSGPRTA